jgi:hypothetical protein
MDDYLGSVDRNTALEPEEIDTFFNEAVRMSNEARRVEARRAATLDVLGWDFGKPTSFAAVRYIKNGIMKKID